MTNKYRTQPSINRQYENQYSDNYWFDQFEKSLEKNSVQPKSELYDQISSVVSNYSKSKYPSVQAAVDDMMKRSGLSEYLDNIKKSEINNSLTKKTAQDNQNATAIERVPSNDKMPKVIQEKPEILQTLQNIINDSKGNLSVPAIINRLQSLHSTDITNNDDWEDDKLIHLVSLYNLQAKKDNPGNFSQFNNLGIRERNSNQELDAADQDAFAILTPAKL